jgi:hypothetical protein
MDGKIRKFPTTFVFNTFSDSVVKFAKNREHYSLFCCPDCAESSDCNCHNSQTRTDIKVISDALER